MKKHTFQGASHTDAWRMVRFLAVVEMPEQETCSEGCHSVGSGDAHPYTVCSPYFREDEEEGNEENQLAADRHEDASFRHADALEEVARDNLETHDG